jgi:molybdopterin-guanine dinucleotide biosynthesis protein A
MNVSEKKPIPVTGFVTAGGRSSRMGKDKAWLRLGGSTLVERVIAAVRPVTASVSIIANDDKYKELGLEVFADRNEGVGPLEAIRTALANSQTRLALVVGCDLPFVSTELLGYMIEASDTYDAVVPLGPDDRFEPLCALYSTGVLETVTALIVEGERRVSPLFERVRTRFIPFHEIARLNGSAHFFMNINTPADYLKARELMRDA